MSRTLTITIQPASKRMMHVAFIVFQKRERKWQTKIEKKYFPLLATHKTWTHPVPSFIHGVHQCILWSTGLGTKINNSQTFCSVVPYIEFIPSPVDHSVAVLSDVHLLREQEKWIVSFATNSDTPDLAKSWINNVRVCTFVNQLTSFIWSSSLFTNELNEPCSFNSKLTLKGEQNSRHVWKTEQKMKHKIK